MTVPRSRLAAALTICSLTIGGCAVRRVDSYLARGVNLASYRTYAWRTVQPGATGDVRLDNNEIFQQRVQAAVEEQLASRGFEKTVGRRSCWSTTMRASSSESTSLSSSRGSRARMQAVHLRRGHADDRLGRRTDERSAVARLVESNIDGVVDNQRWLEEHIDETVAKIFERLPFPLSGRLAPRERRENVGLIPGSGRQSGTDVVAR